MAAINRTDETALNGVRASAGYAHSRFRQAGVGARIRAVFRPAAPMLIHHYTLRSPRPADLDRCHEIERTAYEGDEAATREKIRTRIERYPEGFLLIEVEGVIAGFINAGCTDRVEMSDESFKELAGHDPAGRHAVIMSVVLDPAFQGRGLTTILMHNFVLRMRRLRKSSIQLMCRDRHVGLYEKLGFRYARPSGSAHGGLRWHEMIMPLGDLA